jgi:hypothetical protein
VKREPAFRSFFSSIELPTSTDGLDDGRKPTLLSRLTDRMPGRSHAEGTTALGLLEERTEEPAPPGWHGQGASSELVVAVPPDLSTGTQISPPIGIKNSPPWVIN